MHLLFQRDELRYWGRGSLNQRQRKRSFVDKLSRMRMKGGNELEKGTADSVPYGLLELGLERRKRKGHGSGDVLQSSLEGLVAVANPDIVLDLEGNLMQRSAVHTLLLLVISFVFFFDKR